MTEVKPLFKFIRQRGRDLGLNITALAAEAGISRETLYKLSDAPERLPSLETVVALSGALKVHPIWLLQLIFDDGTNATPSRKQVIKGDKSTFVTETIPDGSLVLAGRKFVKTWEMQNVGKVPWEGRFMQCMDEEVVAFTRTGRELFAIQNLVPHATRIEVPYTAPQETVSISVKYTAPKMPGVYFSYWKAVFADGSFCFPAAQGLSVTVRVVSMKSANRP